MTQRLARHKRGFSIAEMVISLSILAMVFSFLAYLTFYSGRNFAGLHEQIISQVNAANAIEVTANLLRNAAYFSRYPDDPVTLEEVKRLKVAMPLSANSVTTAVLAYHSRNKELYWFDSENQVTFDSDGNPNGTPAKSFPYMESFGIRYESMFRVTLVAGFTYRGFARVLENPGNPQYGQFITDVIAKNHFLDKGEDNYAKDITTSGPATL
ncbi:MAG: prepilin-type N-terminal cleavage/methylation domain-containing protein [Candidatus Hydrogenedentota bacterium]|jgi:prepilin-type N-terminal cleavage/methylation domain-containing protein|uniref:Prepilin-type N-terminal cleavage/methylation domain-containing protein n=1 Tax=Sumerlaea chitinivorans TaxID=2250252 RepID=A0A2Z4Y3S4_SUMC1|nr:hypothetical protein BRCON_0809 [Candidatus Sumerlaea chitinivorans]RMH27357.1 MAG: prepilin-type N-terminal cleavage/methylation domain-containing protein [Candidatus Hydrogenedentota bacterium]GIX44591.1 MAG: hypothetical protein KatS3mg130_0999 [Candidatus Sumerlaea sp.]